MTRVTDSASRYDRTREFLQVVRRLWTQENVDFHGNHSDIEQAMAAGFDDHVTKPAELKRLEQIIAQGMRPR